MKVFLRLSLAASLAVYAIMAGPFVAAATHQAPTKPKPTKPPAKVASTAPSLTKPLYVTPAFMRMRHADYIVYLATQVQSGKAQLSDLARIVGPEIAQSLISTNLKLLQAKIKPLVSAGGSSTHSHGDYGVVTSSGYRSISNQPAVRDHYVVVIPKELRDLRGRNHRRRSCTREESEVEPLHDSQSICSLEWRPESRLGKGQLTIGWSKRHTL